MEWGKHRQNHKAKVLVFDLEESLMRFIFISLWNIFGIFPECLSRAGAQTSQPIFRTYVFLKISLIIKKYMCLFLYARIPKWAIAEMNLLLNCTDPHFREFKICMKIITHLVMCVLVSVYILSLCIDVYI